MDVAYLSCNCPSTTHHTWFQQAHLCEDISDLTDDESYVDTRVRRDLNDWNREREAILEPWSVGRRSHFEQPLTNIVSHWHISQGRRQSTGLLGIPDSVLKGPPIPEGSTREQHLGILIKHGYELVPQDSTRPTMLYDAGGTGFGLISPPRHKPELASYLGDSLGVLARYAKKTAGDKRGDFLVLEAGTQKGGGSLHPKPRASPNLEAKAATKWLLGRRQVKEILSDQGGMACTAGCFVIDPAIADLFRYYFPRTANYYQTTIDEMQERFENIPLPIKRLPFTSMTFNVGRQCICKPHLDSLNLSFGLCSICPLGSFDHKMGGHLVLHEVRRILEVQAASTAFIPSAIISHGNVPIAEDETRQALTSYTPGSYFQYAEEGFAKVPLRTHQEKLDLGAERWRAGIGLLPHFREMLMRI